MKEKKSIYILSFIVLTCIVLYFFCIQFFQLPMGDDLLKPYFRSYQHYLDENQGINVIRITNFRMMFMDRYYSYIEAQGRFTSAFWGPLLGIIGQGWCSLLGALVYLLEILIICTIILDDFKEVFKHPLMVLFIFIQLHSMSHTGDLMQMWTFVCHYGLSILFCLIYWLYWKKHIDKLHGFRYLFVLSLIGLLAGAAHELLPMYVFILVGVKIVIVYKPQQWIRMVAEHVGLILGYLISVLCPGNIVRAQTQHDIRRITTPFLEKIQVSIMSHIKAMQGIDSLTAILMLLCILLVLFSLIHEKKSLKELILNNLEYIVACLASVILWALVAPPVARYSLHLWKAFLLILLLQNLYIPYKVTRTKVFQTCIWLLSIGIIVVHFNWCKVLVDVGRERKTQIREAIEKEEKVVVIDRYPEILRQIQTEIELSNKKNTYNTDYGKLYYGIDVQVRSE